MKEQLIQEVQRQMLSFLNNAQLKQLQSVLEGVLSGVELSHSAGMVESAKVDTVACFINAKRIEGCSEEPELLPSDHCVNAIRHRKRATRDHN